MHKPSKQRFITYGKECITIINWLRDRDISRLLSILKHLETKLPSNYR